MLESNNSGPRRNVTRRKFFWLLLVIPLLFLVVPRPAHAFLGGEVVIAVLNGIVFLCKALVGLAAHFLAMMLSPDLYNFTTEPIIVAGWKICRDICNLFFLLILLFIAFCTILQIEKYHLKKTLLTLIIMALLINFSKPIAIFIFDGAQLLMNYFLGANTNYEATISNLSAIAEIVYKSIPNFFTRWLTWTSDGEVVAQQIICIIFLFMYAVALFVMAIYLFIRIVAMWLIIIVSPFAFLFSAVPDFKKISNDWWDALFKYSYVGPAIAFFLFLSTRLATSHLQTVAQKFEHGKTIVTLPNFIAYITIIVFLYASIIISQKFGIQFASSVTSVANKALAYGTGLNAAKWTGRKAWQGTKYAAKAGAKAAERKWLMPHGLSPRARWGAWKQRAEEIDQKALDIATGASRDQYHKWIDKKQTSYERLAKDRNVAKKMKEISESSEDSKALGNRIKTLVGKDSEEAREELSAVFRILWKNKDQDEMLDYIHDQIKEKRSGFEKFTALGFTEENTVVSAENANGAVKKLLKASGADQKSINKDFLDLGNVAAGNGGIGYGRVTVNGETGELEEVDGDENPDMKGKEAYVQIAKFMTTGEAQDLPKRFHRNHFTDQHGGLNEAGKAALRMYASPVAIQHANRHKNDFLKKVAGDEKVSAEMYKYAAQMRDGTAMGYDADEKKYTQLKVDAGQAKQAAAWIVAVQRKAGVDEADIKKSLTDNGFSEDDITAINNVITNAKK